MSHACCIVAVSPKEIKEAGSIELAVDAQMQPFQETNEWFEDGTRWDLYSIGGRWTGKLTAYDPTKDKDNYESCRFCGGTGTRGDIAYGPEAEWARQPTPAGHPVIGKGCNSCYGTGSRLKFESEFKEIGNICHRSELTDESLKAYAFLRNQTWYERGRLGFFGMPASTECERKAMEEGGEYDGRCLHTCPKTGARIVSFDEESDDRWPNLFFARFIRNLPPDTTLVVVDYHV